MWMVQTSLDISQLTRKGMQCDSFPFVWQCQTSSTLCLWLVNPEMLDLTHQNMTSWKDTLVNSEGYSTEHRNLQISKRLVHSRHSSENMSKPPPLCIYFPRGPCVFCSLFPRPAPSPTMCFGTKLCTKRAELTLLSDGRSVKAITKGTAEDDQPGLEEGQWIYSG